MLTFQPFYPLLLSQVIPLRLWPNLILITKNNILYILELTISLETNIKINSERKASKYYPLRQTLQPNYNQIRFINLSLCALGTTGSFSKSSIDLLKSLSFNYKLQKHILSKFTNITLRCAYYLFCSRNKSWISLDLLHIWEMFHFVCCC